MGSPVLKELYIPYNPNVKHVSPSLLASMAQLERVQMVHCELTCPQVTTLCKAINGGKLPLKELDIRHNRPLEKHWDVDSNILATAVNKLEKVHLVRISGEQLSKILSQSIVHTRLKYLYIEDYIGEVPRELVKEASRHIKDLLSYLRD